MSTRTKSYEIVAGPGEMRLMMSLFSRFPGSPVFVFFDLKQKNSEEKGPPISDKRVFASILGLNREEWENLSTWKFNGFVRGGTLDLDYKFYGTYDHNVRKGQATIEF